MLPASSPKVSRLLCPGLRIFGRRQLQRCPKWWWRGGWWRTEAPAALGDGMIRPGGRVGSTRKVCNLRLKMMDFWWEMFSCILWIPLSVACCFNDSKKATPPNDLPVGNNALRSLVTTVCLPVEGGHWLVNPAHCRTCVGRDRRETAVREKKERGIESSRT